MAMPEFLDNIQNAVKNPTGWLSPATVADLSESDFHTIRPALREKLFQAVERFRVIAETASPTPEQVAEARAAIDAIRAIVQPYLTPESEQIRETIAKAWQKERDWIPTFDYELGNNWLGEPVVRLWLVVKDDVLPDDMDIKNPSDREGLWRVKDAIRKEFNDAGIKRWPNISFRTESGVKEYQELRARATA
jgi:hypothetical protein